MDTKLNSAVKKEIRKQVKINGSHMGTVRTAIETQTPIKPILFVDNDDRLNHKSIFSLTPGISRCVFLDEVKVDGYKNKNDIKQLKQKIHNKMEEALIQYRKSQS